LILPRPRANDHYDDRQTAKSELLDVIGIGTIEQEVEAD
jgi:hypothetical protein